MGIVTSSIYSTTAQAPMTRLEFSTDFQGANANVTVKLMKEATVIQTETYKLNPENLIAKIAIGDSTIESTATLTLATHSTSVVFSGVCVWKDVTSFSATNVAIAYR